MSDYGSSTGPDHLDEVDDPYGYEDDDCEWCGLGPQECRCVPFDEPDDPTQ
jgi:hypothetical protein